MGRKPKSAIVHRPLNTTDNTVSPLEIMRNDQHKEISRSTSSMKKVFARRSNRLKNMATHVPNNEVVPEKIYLADSDGQDTGVEPKLTNELKEPHTEEELSTEPTSSLGDMEEKINFLVQSVKEFKSMFSERNIPNTQNTDELNFKELYVDAQKKIDSLIEEIHEQNKRLEFARGKVEAYEQMKDSFANFKETILFANFAKVAEAIINISSQAGTTAAKCGCFTGSPSPAHPAPAPPPPPPPDNNNNDHMQVVGSSPEGNQRRRKKIKVIT